MAQPPWFCLTLDQGEPLAERLLQEPCPHCKQTGTLVRHGFLYGFDDANPLRKTRRARRLICSYRGTRTGCGRTLTLWAADKVRRLGLTTPTLTRFLHQVLDCGLRATLRTFLCPLSDRTLLRVWKRFLLAQSTLRNALWPLDSPPSLPQQLRPETQVLAHLHAAFPEASCPLAAFQRTTRTFFL